MQSKHYTLVTCRNKALTMKLVKGENSSVKGTVEGFRNNWALVKNIIKCVKVNNPNLNRGAAKKNDPDRMAHFWMNDTIRISTNFRARVPNKGPRAEYIK